MQCNDGDFLSNYAAAYVNLTLTKVINIWVIVQLNRNKLPKYSDLLVKNKYTIIHR